MIVDENPATLGTVPPHYPGTITLVATADDIDALKAQIRERDGRIEVLLKQVAALSPPPEPNAPTISVGDVTAAAGQRTVTVPVTLSEPTNHTITARWSTANGAGTWNQYVPAAGWLVWQPGEKTKVVTVTLTKDLSSSQNVQVNIVGVPGYPGSKTAKSRGLISGGASELAAPIKPDSITMPDRPKGQKLTWTQNFADPAFCATSTGFGPSGATCWQTRPNHGITQDGNKELGVYATPPRFPNVTFTGIGPDGKRFIQLERHTEGFKNEAGKLLVHAWDGKPYTYSSAMLTGIALPLDIGEGSYVEARLRMDFMQGIWPAFWLLPKKGGWPPELDIFEGFWTHNRASKEALTTTLHWRNRMGTHVQYGVDPPLAMQVPGFDVREWHTYGIHIERDWLTFYVDDVPTARMPNPTPRGSRWYPLLDVTTGGAVGEPSADAQLPAKMGLDWINVWN